jgi:hypothetical protein
MPSSNQVSSNLIPCIHILKTNTEPIEEEPIDSYYHNMTHTNYSQSGNPLPSAVLSVPRGLCSPYQPNPQMKIHTHSLPSPTHAISSYIPLPHELLDSWKPTSPILPCRVLVELHTY